MVVRVTIIFGIMLLIITSMMSILRRQPSEAYWITYTIQDDTGRWRIYRTFPNLEGKRIIAGDSYFSQSPIISPDGKMIVFNEGMAGYSQIYKMDINGLRIQQLSRDEQDSRVGMWSPDGQWLSYSIHEDGIWNSYLMASDGTVHYKVGGQLGVYAGHVSWSPDGESIVFHAEVVVDNLTLYRSANDGTNIVQLTDSSYEAYYPLWSPDGEWILFTSRVISPTPNNFLYRIRPDCTQLQRLTPDFISPSNPSWSHDGQWIVFVGSPDSNTTNIYRMRSDGSDLKQLTQNPYVNRLPKWSPDGQWILYKHVSSDNRPRLFRVRPDGSELEQLAIDAWRIGEFQFSPLISRPLNQTRLLIVGISLLFIGILATRMKGTRQ